MCGCLSVCGCGLYLYVCSCGVIVCGVVCMVVHVKCSVCGCTYGGCVWS